MATLKDRVSVAGSDRAPLPKAHIAGPADPHERMQVSIIVRRRSSADAVTELSRDLGARQPRERQHLSRKEFASLHGAHPDDLEKIRSFAGEHGLEVTKVYPGQRRVVLAGTVAAFSKAFGVELARYEHPGGSYRGRVGPVYIPKDLAAVVEGVFGLDDRPQARPHFRAAKREDAAGKAATSYLPTQVAKLYDFPSGGDGNGECIGIVELGGGYRTADLKAYFARLGLPAPKIGSRSVDGAKNRPTGDPNGPDGEVMLDIEVAGAVAPKAKIVVYFAPNTDAGFLDAIASAVHDTVNKPSVISISWGAAEMEWTAQAMNAMDQAFQDAAALGVTVCCASGGRRLRGRRNRRARARRLPRFEPARARLWRHPSGGSRRHDQERGGLERRCERRRDRRRRQQSVRPARVAERRECTACRQPRRTCRAGRAGCRRRRRSGDRVRGARRRTAVRDRWNERGRPAVGRLDRADQSAAPIADRFRESAALSAGRAAGVPRHHGREQRRLPRATGLGPVHRARQPRRSEAAVSARRVVSLSCPIPLGLVYDGGGYGATGCQPLAQVLTYGK